MRGVNTRTLRGIAEKWMNIFRDRPIFRTDLQIRTTFGLGWMGVIWTLFWFVNPYKILDDPLWTFYQSHFLIHSQRSSCWTMLTHMYTIGYWRETKSHSQTVRQHAALCHTPSFKQALTWHSLETKLQAAPVLARCPCPLDCQSLWLRWWPWVLVMVHCKHDIKDIVTLNLFCVLNGNWAAWGLYQK